jgi:hypothetical protein
MRRERKTTSAAVLDVMISVDTGGEDKITVSIYLVQQIWT